MKKRGCLPLLLPQQIGFVTFFLSSVLDNLTSTIVMVSLLRKLVPPSEYRKLLGAVVGIAANAGGAWTPIGDVTTTMRSIHGRISTLETMKNLAIPSAISLAVPLALMSLTRRSKRHVQRDKISFRYGFIKAHKIHTYGTGTISRGIWIMCYDMHT
ncbi:hypothetical protein FEM48_Zijuj07G0034700 [Ziziphus jujuba var. spinosa]|uniref:Citrate transporter-like domain-containing protein n=1 Tax=Ziziphus jujuba var. spinosa TaxID=714518 RepID=A0A978V270_ZIZJJ|nr:hypothetical protein FEM48_Zijuj07G0034700 [Ziziphus jujuba var. spinosa]